MYISHIHIVLDIIKQGHALPVGAPERRAEALTLHLTHFPVSLGNLHNLKTLSIFYCMKLTLCSLIDSFGRLKELTTFNIEYFDNLTHIVLPNSICFCTNLQNIVVSNINMLPPSMMLLEKLNDITVRNKNGETIYNINEMRTQLMSRIV